MDKKFYSELFKERMMGPNSVLLLDEALNRVQPKGKFNNILDLGPGRGLTSIYLYDRFQTPVTAFDSWIPASENQQFFDQEGYMNNIQAVQGDANALPFKPQCFDMLVSVDAYQYFGLSKDFFKEKIRPFLKPNSPVVIIVPGLLHEKYTKQPECLKPFLTEIEWLYFQSKETYRSFLEEDLKDLTIVSLDTQKEAWQLWLAVDSNEYAVSDRPFIKAEKGLYIDIFLIFGYLK